METSRKRFYFLLTLSFVLLFNPNITVVDLLPDFIAWFILARLFERAANSAVHFEEARICFVRLGWLNLAKIPAFFIVIFVRSSDVLDNNIYALASFSFAVLELLFLIPAIKHIFDGLFHLGERSDATALIASMKDSKGRERSADSIKEFTYLFVICKTVTYALPDLFLLTRVSERGTILAFSSYYPYVLIFGQIIGYAVGIAWLLRIRKYARAVFNEGKFNEALDKFASEDSYVRFAKKTKLRSIGRAMLLFSVASVSSVELTFNSFDGDIGNALNGINLLPHFIFGFLLLFAVGILAKHANVSKLAFLFGALYTAVSVVSYVLSVRFYKNYDLDNLMKEDFSKIEDAISSYRIYEIFSALELALLLAFLLYIAFALRSFVFTNTGLSRESERYGRMEKEFHKSMLRRSYIMVGFAALVGIMKCAYVFVNANVETVFTDENNVTMPTITASTMPWFNVVLNAIALIYIGFSFYHTSTLKDEAKIKYSE